MRQAVAEVQQNIEGRDAGALRRHLAEDFIGPGGMDRDQARRTAALYMMQHQSVGLTMGPLEIQLQEPHATVRFSAALTGGSGRLLPDQANLYQVETGWEMEDGQWRITSARWTAAR
ncbi:nuclear transport factor 2 family protein [Luteimonas sp. A478]